jgi:hypothetical protein
MYNGNLSIFINKVQIDYKCRLEFIHDKFIFHFNYLEVIYEIPFDNFFNEEYKLNDSNIIKIKDVIYNDKHILITGVIIDVIEKKDCNFLINFNNCEIEVIKNYQKWNITKKNSNTLLDIISYNNMNNYNQGEFANNISRKDLYELSKNVCLQEPEYLKIFLIKTLSWGDYDKVYAIPHGNPLGIDLIESTFNKDYNEKFIKLFENKPKIFEIYKAFQSKKPLNICHIGPAYFTKFLHFYSYGKDLSPKMLILDKWSILAWATLMIEQNSIKNDDLIKKLIYLDSKTKKLKTKLTPIGKEYSDFNTYIIQTANSISIEPNKFEELMFGWDLSINKNGFVNPRIHNINICKYWLKK